MASILKNKDEKEPKARDDDAAREERQEKEPAAPADQRAAAEDRRDAASGPGFFTIYKKGQGYWTRMGTALGAALIGVLIAHFFYTYVPTWVSAAMLGRDPTPPEVARAARVSSYWGIGVASGFLIAFAML